MLNQLCTLLYKIGLSWNFMPQILSIWHSLFDVARKLPLRTEIFRQLLVC